MKFESEIYHFHSRKYIWKCRLPNWRPFCPGADEINHCVYFCNEHVHTYMGHSTRWCWNKMIFVFYHFHSSSPVWQHFVLVISWLVYLDSKFSDFGFCVSEKLNILFDTYMIQRTFCQILQCIVHLQLLYLFQKTIDRYQLTLNNSYSALIHVISNWYI